MSRRVKLFAYDIDIEHLHRRRWPSLLVVSAAVFRYEYVEIYSYSTRLYYCFFMVTYGQNAYSQL